MFLQQSHIVLLYTVLSGESRKDLIWASWMDAAGLRHWSVTLQLLPLLFHAGLVPSCLSLCWAAKEVALSHSGISLCSGVLVCFSQPVSQPSRYSRPCKLPSSATGIQFSELNEIPFLFSVCVYEGGLVGPECIALVWGGVCCQKPYMLPDCQDIALQYFFLKRLFGLQPFWPGRSFLLIWRLVMGVYW